MNILIDHCVPKPFRRSLPGHDVKTAAEMGWSTLQNGKLLFAASQAFDVFITVDKNLQHQQNLGTFAIRVIILDALSNTVAALAPFAPLVETTLLTLQPSQAIVIDSSGHTRIVSPIA